MIAPSAPLHLSGNPPWSPATATLWAILSGYAPHIRRDKPLAFLRAFTDDSASEKGDRRLFMAGYLNRAEKWALFSEAWYEELRAPPSIEYLKMAEAQNLKDQFKGWTAEARDEKLRGLARVIRHFEPLSFQFSISRADFYRIVTPVSPRGLGNPHFVCCLAILSGVSRFAADKGGNIPIEFIFDKQEGVSEDIEMAFNVFKTEQPAAARNLIRGKPRFEDDKDLAPLQAADLLAWHVRREHEEGAEIPMTTRLWSKSGHFVIGEIDSPTMERWAEHHRQQPGVELLRTKHQWRAWKREYYRLSSLGFIPPHGSRWKNALHRARDFFKRILRLIRT